MEQDVTGQRNEQRFAYSIAGWADACSITESEVKRAIGEGSLEARRTASGRLIITAEDGLTWLRQLDKL